MRFSVISILVALIHVCAAQQFQVIDFIEFFPSFCIPLTDEVTTSPTGIQLGSGNRGGKPLITPGIYQISLSSEIGFILPSDTQIFQSEGTTTVEGGVTYYTGVVELTVSPSIVSNREIKLTTLDGKDKNIYVETQCDPPPVLYSLKNEDKNDFVVTMSDYFDATASGEIQVINIATFTNNFIVSFSFLTNLPQESENLLVSTPSDIFNQSATFSKYFSYSSGRPILQQVDDSSSPISIDTNRSIFEIENPTEITHTQQCPRSTTSFTVEANTYQIDYPNKEETLVSINMLGSTPAHIKTLYGDYVTPIIDFSPARDTLRWRELDTSTMEGGVVDCREITSTVTGSTFSEAFSELQQTYSTATLFRGEKNSDDTFTIGICSTGEERCLKIESCDGALPDLKISDTSDHTLFILSSEEEMGENTYAMITSPDATFSRSNMIDPFTTSPPGGESRKIKDGLHIGDVSMPLSTRPLKIYQSDVDKILSIRGYPRGNPKTISTINLGYICPFGITPTGLVAGGELGNSVDLVAVSVQDDNVLGAVYTSGEGVELSTVMTWATPGEIIPSVLQAGGLTVWDNGLHALAMVGNKVEISVGGIVVTRSLAQAQTEEGLPWGSCVRLSSSTGEVFSHSIPQGYDFSPITGISNSSRVMCAEGYTFSVVLTYNATVVQLEQQHSAYSLVTGTPVLPVAFGEHRTGLVIWKNGVVQSGGVAAIPTRGGSMVIDKVLLHRGRVGGTYPVDLVCPDDTMSPCSVFGEIDSACGTDIPCGRIPYHIAYSSAPSLIWGRTPLQMGLPYPGTGDYLANGTWPVGITSLVSSTDTINHLSVAVAFSEAAAFHPRHIVNDTIPPYVTKIPPVCSPEKATFARLSANSTSGRNMTIVSTSATVSVGTLPFVKSVVLAGARHLYSNPTFFTFGDVSLVWNQDWFGDSSLKITVHTQQTFGLSPPHIPVMHDVTMTARDTITNTLCKFVGVYADRQRNSIDEMILTTGQIESSIIAFGDLSIQEVIMQNGKTIVTKHVDTNPVTGGEGTPYWRSATSVNMVLVTEACKSFTEFSTPVVNVSHSYHVPITNMYQLYQVGEPGESRIMYISSIVDSLFPRVRLADVTSAVTQESVVQITAESPEITTVMSLRESKNVIAGPSPFTLTPPEVSTTTPTVFVVQASLGVSTEGAFITSQEQLQLRQLLATDNGVPINVVAIISVGDTPTHPTVVVVTITFEILTRAQSSELGAGEIPSLPSQYGDVSVLDVKIIESTVPKEVSITQLETFKGFDIHADTNSFVHGVALHDCVDKILSLEELQDFKYELSANTDLGYLRQMMMPAHSNFWGNYKSIFSQHPSPMSVTEKNNCTENFIIKDVYGQSGTAGNFLVSTTEAHIFALEPTTRPFINLGHVVVCLTMRNRASGFGVTLTSGSSIQEIISPFCNELESPCDSSELTVHLKSGTPEARNFTRERTCTDTTTGVDLSSSGDICIRSTEVTSSSNVTLPVEVCDDLECTSSTSVCDDTPLDAFKYNIDSTTKLFKIVVDSVSDTQGNTVMVSTVTLDLSLFAGISSKLALKQYLHVGSLPPDGQRRANPAGRSYLSVTETSTPPPPPKSDEGVGFGRSTVPVPMCENFAIKNSQPGETSLGVAEDLPPGFGELHCPSQQCEGGVEIQPSSPSTNYEMRIECVASSPGGGGTSAPPHNTSIWLLVGAALGGGFLVTILTMGGWYWWKCKKSANLPTGIIGQEATI